MARQRELNKRLKERKERLTEQKRLEDEKKKIEIELQRKQQQLEHEQMERRSRMLMRELMRKKREMETRSYDEDSDESLLHESQKHNAWIRHTTPECDDIQPACSSNGDITSTRKYEQTPASFDSDSTPTIRRSDQEAAPLESDTTPTRRRSEQAAALRDSDTTPTRRRRDQAPALRDSDTTPTRRRRDQAPALRDSDTTPTRRRRDQAPALRDSDKTPTRIRHEQAPALRDSDTTPTRRRREQAPALRGSETTPTRRRCEQGPRESESTPTRPRFDQPPAPCRNDSTPTRPRFDQPPAPCRNDTTPIWRRRELSHVGGGVLHAQREGRFGRGVTPVNTNVPNNTPPRHVAQRFTSRRNLVVGDVTPVRPFSTSVTPKRYNRSVTPVNGSAPTRRWNISQPKKNFNVNNSDTFDSTRRCGKATWTSNDKLTDLGRFNRRNIENGQIHKRSDKNGILGDKVRVVCCCQMRNACNEGKIVNISPKCCLTRASPDIDHCRNDRRVHKNTIFSPVLSPIVRYDERVLSPVKRYEETVLSPIVRYDECVLSPIKRYEETVLSPSVPTSNQSINDKNCFLSSPSERNDLQIFQKVSSPIMSPQIPPSPPPTISGYVRVQPSPVIARSIPPSPKTCDHTLYNNIIGRPLKQRDGRNWQKNNDIFCDSSDDEYFCLPTFNNQSLFKNVERKYENPTNNKIEAKSATEVYSMIRSSFEDSDDGWEEHGDLLPSPQDSFFSPL
eukprot:GHVL01008003.1.p1 GENE.GHVL01008003.1~~GHVL01008003.1.p1  ORF type:complete len:733 (-),score=160.21 GHVL01008003.1:55-2253(-)